MTNYELKFWKEVYVAATHSGAGPETAKERADFAVMHLKKAIDE